MASTSTSGIEHRGTEGSSGLWAAEQSGLSSSRKYPQPRAYGEKVKESSKIYSTPEREIKEPDRATGSLHFTLSRTAATLNRAQLLDWAFNSENNITIGIMPEREERGGGERD